MGQVLAQNVPAGSGWWWSLLGNALVAASAKFLFIGLIVPKAASWLARLRHIDLLDVQASQAASVLVLNVVAVLLAPMVAVFVLVQPLLDTSRLLSWIRAPQDESCLRRYLWLAEDLRSLLEQWGIGQMGAAAYRPQFCSRLLLTEFSYGVCVVLVAH